MTVKLKVLVPEFPSVSVTSPIVTVALSSLLIVPVPASEAVAPVKVTLRPPALSELSTSERVSLSSTVDSPVIVTSTV